MGLSEREKTHITHLSKADPPIVAPEDIRPVTERIDTNGQVVVARVGDDVTVKRLHRRGHSIELLPENPDYAPIVIDARSEDFALEGIAVGLLRAGKGL